MTPYLDHLLKSDLHQNRHKISQDTPLQLNCVYFMLLYNLWPVQGPKIGQNGWKYKYLVICAIGIWSQSFSYNSYIVQCCPHIWGEGGGGQGAKSHFEEGGGGQWAKPHFGTGGGGGQRAKPHLSWIGYYLEMEVINKVDTKLFSLFYISKGKSMEINCIFSKMTKVHNLTPCLWHPIWTTCWSLIFTKIHKKYLKISLYKWVVCILCYYTTCGLYRGRNLVKNGENSFFDHLLKSHLHQNSQKVSQDIPVQMSGVYSMLLYNLWPVQGPKFGQKWGKFIFWHPVFHTLFGPLAEVWSSPKLT